jgi:hypothetical protein
MISRALIDSTQALRQIGYCIGTDVGEIIK